MVAVLLIWAILPESLPPARRGLHARAEGRQLTQMRQALFGSMGLLFFISFLVNFGLTAFEGVFGLYTAHRYNFGPTQVGMVLTVIGVISAVVQGAAMGMNNAFMSLGRIVGPLWAGTLLDWHDGFPYLSGGIIMLISFVMSLRWLTDRPRPPISVLTPSELAERL